VRQQGDNGNDDAMARQHGMATAAAKGTETNKEDAMVTVAVTMRCQGDGVDNEKRCCRSRR